MLTNFQLAAIVKNGGHSRLLRVPLHQALQDTLAIQWHAQYEAFTDGVHEIPFDAGYSPDSHEMFRLGKYDLPDWINGENSLTIHNLDAISNNEALIDTIRGIAAFARDEAGRELVLFQNFSRSHVIHPGRFLFMQNDAYETAQRPGLTLDGKLAAIYVPAQRQLFFHNFRTANTFLPLADFYEEASEQDIREMLAHERLAAEDPDALAIGASQWFRKRFAMLSNSGIIDEYTPQQIVDHSVGYEVEIQLEDGKIVFPSNKSSAKRLLQFLNEELFRGAITETLYETNSKREAD